MSNRSTSQLEHEEVIDSTYENVKDRSKHKRKSQLLSNKQSNHRDERNDRNNDRSKRRRTDTRSSREIRLIDLPLDFDLINLDPFIKPFRSVNARFSTESLDLLDSIKQSNRFNRDATLSAVVEFEMQESAKQFYTVWNQRLTINRLLIKFEVPSFIQQLSKLTNDHRTSQSPPPVNAQSNPMAGLFQQKFDDDLPRVDQSVPQSITQFMSQFYTSPAQQSAKQAVPHQPAHSEPPNTQFSSVSISTNQAIPEVTNQPPLNQPTSIQQQYDLSAPLSLHSADPTKVLCVRDLHVDCVDRDLIRYAFAAHSAIEWIHVSIPHSSALIQFSSPDQAQTVKQLCDNQKIKIDKYPLTVMFAKPNPPEQPMHQPILNGQAGMVFDQASRMWHIPEMGLFYDQSTQQWVQQVGQPQAHPTTAPSLTATNNQASIPALLVDTKVFDCDRFVCWLCERVFADLKHLTWHAQDSELHRSNTGTAKDAVSNKYLHLMNEHRALEVTESAQRPLLK